MAGKKERGDIEEVLVLFPRGSAAAIQRLLTRAQNKAVAAASIDVVKAMHGLQGSHRGSQLGRHLASELAKAARRRGAPRKGAPSMRHKAPDGGGRSFHFAHSVVTKANPTARPSRRASKTGTAAAHMRYIERETAVERLSQDAAIEAVAETIGREGSTKGAGSWDPEIGERGATGPSMGAAAAAQGYIENPAKLANGESSVFSFGNIGQEFEQRLHFWTALEEAETRLDARVQHRLILELPHEASPAARHEIVRRFAKRFVDDGVPFWAALHAPGPKNDLRNYHAHIVYSERPAKRMVDPTDNSVKWDFEIRGVRITKSRNRFATRPMRQVKLREYNNRSFIPSLRTTFAEITNEILTREDVRDAAGEPVRYDHRSYKGMGLDVVPMASIDRFVADKMKAGTATVLDEDYTKKLVSAEIQLAATDRDKKEQDLQKLERALKEIAETPARLWSVDSWLQLGKPISPFEAIFKPALKTATQQLLEARHAALLLEVVERATTASLERIVEATAPKTVAAAARSRDPIARAQAPDPPTAALLHEAATNELADTQAATVLQRRDLAARIERATEVWRRVIGPSPTATSPIMRAAPVRPSEATTAPGTTGANSVPPPPMETTEKASIISRMLLDRVGTTRAAGRPNDLAAISGGPNRAPTLLELMAASRGVGGIIKAAKARGLTLDERLESMQASADDPIVKPTHVSLSWFARVARMNPFPSSLAKSPEDQSGRMARWQAFPSSTVKTPAESQPVVSPNEPPAAQAAAPQADPPAQVRATPTAPVENDRASQLAEVATEAEALAPSTAVATAQPAQMDLRPPSAPRKEGGRARPPASIVIGEPEPMRVPGVPDQAADAIPAHPVAALQGAEPAHAPDPAPSAEAVQGNGKRRRTPEELEEIEKRNKKRRAVLAKKQRRRGWER